MRFFIILFSSSVFFLLFSCGEEKAEVQQQEKKLTDIRSVKINLPDSAGKELFEANCKTCHSDSYIQMQPDFPRKTWQKIVDKMQKSFGAPLDSVTSAKIVDYLVAIKGKK